MKKIQTNILKVLMLISLIGICFTPNVYADPGFISMETQIYPNEGMQDTYMDYSYLNLNFSQVGEPSYGSERLN